MQPSLIGLLVAAALYALGRQFGGGLVFALMAALAFGATAFASLPALGGASTLIYSLFALALVLGLALRLDALSNIRAPRNIAATSAAWEAGA